ncbi:MAG: hypothetical protein HY843_09270 [Bdellovibrio sp.]|nr:hypothetical protein [Bdellovibrio sp.]
MLVLLGSFKKPALLRIRLIEVMLTANPFLLRLFCSMSSPFVIFHYIGGNTVELFSALMKIDIETAKSVKNKALGTDIAQIISYAEQTFGGRD